MLKTLHFINLRASGLETDFLSFGVQLKSYLETLQIQATTSALYFLKGLEKQRYNSSLNDLF
eukprot:snap_masked-scaffold_9-processed-gene-10.32-mRNA-1 protein AED:1.00 eAED:1.00 QI:0/-1/0/0/-1/1/1/0/61